MKRLIAFSLWGGHPRYTAGALRNAQLAPSVYPGWTCRFYVGASTPADVVAALEGMAHVEVVRREEPGDWRGAGWRFLAAADPEAEVVLSRDADSRLDARERAAVDEWLASGRGFHLMRDHPFHSRWPILAGMWGVRGRLLEAMPAWLEGYFAGRSEAPGWGVDQVFLARVVHPRVRRETLVHDDLSPPLAFDAESERRPFPSPRRGLEFVGQVFDERDRPVPRHVEALAEWLRGRGQGGSV